MKFRTEIEITPSKACSLSHADNIVLLGSCFSDNIGSRLTQDGFSVTINPFGPLYNPASIRNLIDCALSGKIYGEADFTADAENKWHALDFASRFSSFDSIKLCDEVNVVMGFFKDALCKASTLIVTLGTAYAYFWKNESEEKIVGNCHKFPASCFSRRLLSVNEIEEEINGILALLPTNIKNIIFTISPIRHLADGLHGNEVSKASLMVALNNAQQADSGSQRFIYFPSYEIMIDDLRDYRFYAADMKHPSDVAVEYIYQAFKDVFFTEKTKQQCQLHYKEYLRNNHRPILPSKD